MDYRTNPHNQIGFDERLESKRRNRFFSLTSSKVLLMMHLSGYDVGKKYSYVLISFSLNKLCSYCYAPNE